MNHTHDGFIHRPNASHGPRWQISAGIRSTTTIEKETKKLTRTWTWTSTGGGDDHLLPMWNCLESQDDLQPASVEHKNYQKLNSNQNTYGRQEFFNVHHDSACPLGAYMLWWPERTSSGKRSWWGETREDDDRLVRFEYTQLVMNQTKRLDRFLIVLRRQQQTTGRTTGKIKAFPAARFSRSTLSFKIIL